MSSAPARKPVVYENRETGQRWEVHGELIGHGDNRDEGRDHWVEVDVFRTSSGAHAVHRAGMSLVYHRWSNATCRLATGKPKGLAATRDDLPEGAVSCDVCEPVYPEELMPGEKVLFEFPRHGVKVIEGGPAEVARDLFRSRRGRELGKPARLALEQCIGSDPAFAEALAGEMTEVIQ